MATYERLTIVSIEDVFKVLKSKKKKTQKFLLIDGYKIKAFSHRLRTYCEHGIVCVNCGIEGKYFAAERDSVPDKNLVGDPSLRPYHLNFYAIGTNGEEVMMTADHILPDSAGGPSHLDNYQTMCRPCNEAKRAEFSAADREKFLERYEK